MLGYFIEQEFRSMANATLRYQESGGRKLFTNHQSPITCPLPPVLNQ
jgi:hypothetical protein